MRRESQAAGTPGKALARGHRAAGPVALPSAAREPKPHQHPSSSPVLPMLVTVSEAADLLRTSREAVYAMVARGQIPGVTRIGRRVLIRSHDLLDWLDQKRAPSSKE